MTNVEKQMTNVSSSTVMRVLACDEFGCFERFSRQIDVEF